MLFGVADPAINARNRRLEARDPLTMIVQSGRVIVDRRRVIIGDVGQVGDFTGITGCAVFKIVDVGGVGRNVGRIRFGLTFNRRHAVVDVCDCVGQIRNVCRVGFGLDLAQLESITPVYTFDPTTGRRYLNDAQRADAIVSAKKSVSEWCK